MAVRFIHAADLHLDTPFTARARYPEHVATILRDASLGAFDRLIEAALAHQVHFAVFAGDIYDGAERGVRAQLAFRDGLQRLSEAGIRSFVAHGNHDPVGQGWTAVGSFADLVEIFPAGRVASYAFEADGQPVTVHGISYGQARVTENLTRHFQRAESPGLHVGVLHANVGNNPEHDPYSPCSVDDLADLHYDYWALGHIHAGRVLQRDPWIVYPGNLQGRSIKAAESGPKGALLVEVDGTRVLEPTLLVLDGVRFASVEVDATGLGLDRLVDALAAAGEQAQVEAEGRSLLLTARVVGRADELMGRLRSGDLADELLRVLRDGAGRGEPFLWWDAIDVAARPPLDLERLLATDGFVADVVTTSARIASSGDHDPRSEWSDRVSHDILRAAGLGPEGFDLDELWAEATDLAIDLLAEEQL